MQKISDDVFGFSANEEKSRAELQNRSHAPSEWQELLTAVSKGNVF